MIEARVHFKVTAWISFDTKDKDAQALVQFCDRAKANPKILKEITNTYKFAQDIEEVKDYIVENKE
jgi:hypothetical protein